MKARETLSPLRIVMMILISALFMLWLVIPFMLTVLWSLVDKTHPWAWPDALPPVLSLGRWVEVWTTTALPQALRNSYLLAATVSVCTLMLSLPAAWAFGRMSFTGKRLLQNAILLPLIVPGFVVALFFSMLLNVAGIHSRFGGILLGHIIILMPYAVRILTLSFSQIRQDTLDAARDMGASVINRFFSGLPAHHQTGNICRINYCLYVINRRVRYKFYCWLTRFYYRPYHSVFLSGL